MSGVIITGGEFSSKNWTQLEKIFFASSAITEFSSEESKNKFYHKYFGHYRKNYPEFFFAYIQDDQAMGYICGAPSTLEDPEFLNSHGYYSCFKDDLKKFPAHLHINMHADLRGQGVGSLLLDSFIQSMKKREVRGVHIITSPEAKNRFFYEKNGFDFQKEELYQGTPLLFMGKSIL